MFIFKFFGFIFIAILALFGFFFIFSAMLILRTILFSGFKKKFFKSTSYSSGNAGNNYSSNNTSQSTQVIEAEYRILTDKDK
jgi:hypothetical protein